MPRRRRSVFSGPSYGRSAMWLEPGMRRRRGWRRVPGRAAALLALVVAAGAGGYVDAGTQRAYPLRRFEATYRAAAAPATVTAVQVGRAAEPRGGRVAVPVTVRTRTFGTLRGTVALPMVRTGGDARVRWRPYLRLPGLRPGESVRRRILRRFGERVVRRVRVRRGRSVHATLRPGLQTAALAALGNRVGGIAVLRPRDGSVLALAGLAVSAPQPPGSTFKIITLAAALQARIARPSSTYPVRTAATLSGVRLRNANDESCGGTLVTAFAVSCNSVFAPLGARLGARRLVQMAQAFGFNEMPRVPSAKRSRISPPSRLKDGLAVGAAAIGQDRDLATPLAMASVAATIGNRGVRAKPRVVRADPVSRRRVVRAGVARQVRGMMIGVVQGGTGTAANIPGVQVAGKTGTAELRPTAGGPPDPRNTDAWFVAFAPATNPRVAVAVMLVGAGAGGAAAAPIARQVLQAAL
jgi:peptidoglycan glycosyltransferase